VASSLKKGITVVTCDESMTSIPQAEQVENPNDIGNRPVRIARVERIDWSKQQINIRISAIQNIEVEVDFAAEM
jgi:hypothetical protein